MNVREAYEEWSRTYDSDGNATRDLDQLVLERVLGTSRFESIIEIGCGTGKNTGLLSRLGGRVKAMDFSPGMLQRAKAKAGHLGNVSFALADITQPWPCPERFADLVTCNLVLEHVPELQPVFAEAARVLSKGGLFFLCELHPFRQYEGTVATYQRNEETIEIPAFVHHISDFLETGRRCGFRLSALQEWWHEKDERKPPRLASYLFERAG